MIKAFFQVSKGEKPTYGGFFEAVLLLMYNDSSGYAKYTSKPEKIEQKKKKKKCMSPVLLTPLLGMGTIFQMQSGKHRAQVP